MLGEAHSSKIQMRLVTLVLLGAIAASGADREVAITIDDLPRGADGGPRNLAGIQAMTERLLKPFRGEKIPVIGFVNAGRVPELGLDGLRQILNLWLDAGADPATTPIHISTSTTCC